MKYLSKKTKAIVALNVMILAALCAYTCTLNPNMSLWIILAFLLTSLTLVSGFIALDTAYERINELECDCERETIVATKFNVKHLPRTKTDKLYMCKNRSHRFCSECEHAIPHEHNEQCAIHECELIVAVYG